VVHVLIVVEAEADGQALLTMPAAQAEMVGALKRSIAANPISEASSETVEIVTGDGVSAAAKSQANTILCPLTLNLPLDLHFPEQAIYQTCRNVLDLRQWVEQKLSFSIGEGKFWLPVVLTAKGPLYAEVIGKTELAASEDIEHEEPDYLQPIHLPDRWRQPLYQLGQELLRSLAAPPATYLLQFGLQNQQICFDRLFPFPAVPAIASLGIQTPDLFTCHWCCLTRQPILDLTIPSPVSYQLLEG
jgi:hypothetical protein